MAGLMKVHMFACMVSDGIDLRFYPDGSDDAAECADNPVAWPVWYVMRTDDIEALIMNMFLYLRLQFKDVEAGGGWGPVFEQVLLRARQELKGA